MRWSRPAPPIAPDTRTWHVARVRRASVALDDVRQRRMRRSALLLCAKGAGAASALLVSRLAGVPESPAVVARGPRDDLCDASSASAGGTRLDELDRDANAWQLEALRWRAAVAERLGGTVLKHLADLDRGSSNCSAVNT
jgi:hypothetical protein